MEDLKLYAKIEKELDSLIQTVRVFSKDIGMQFGIEKCWTLVMRRGKRIKSDGIKMRDDKVMESLKEGEGYKYLGVIHADEVQLKEMKGKIGSKYNYYYCYYYYYYYHYYHYYY